MLRFRCLEYGHMMEEAQDASDLAKKRQNGCGSTQSRQKNMEDTVTQQRQVEYCVSTQFRPNMMEESDDA